MGHALMTTVFLVWRPHMGHVLISDDDCMLLGTGAWGCEQVAVSM